MCPVGKLEGGGGEEGLHSSTYVCFGQPTQKREVETAVYFCVCVEGGAQARWTFNHSLVRLIRVTGYQNVGLYGIRL